MALDYDSAIMESKSKNQKQIVSSTYQNLINTLSTEGFWSDKSLILGFLSDPSAASTLLSSHDPRVILTLLALHILTKNFSDKKNEWKMIAKKAQKWLKSQNVEEV